VLKRNGNTTLTNAPLEIAHVIYEVLNRTENLSSILNNIKLGGARVRLDVAQVIECGAVNWVWH